MAIPLLASVRRADAAATFQAYSALHAMTVAAFLGVTLLAAFARRRLRGTPSARHLDVALAVGGIVVWVWYKVWGFLPANYSAEFSWPAQMCDFTSLIAPLVLLTCNRPLRAILYFCGIGLSSMGFFTPDLHVGPGHTKFWLFWLSHATIVGTALYDVAARDFRPTWRDYRTAVAFAVAYATFALSIDLASGYSYGYVGPSRPGQPPILDALGTWPTRLPVMFVLAAGVMAMLQLPWVIARRSAGDGAAPPPASL